MRPKKINTIILGNLSSKVNRLTKKSKILPNLVGFGRILESWGGQSGGHREPPERPRRPCGGSNWPCRIYRRQTGGGRRPHRRRPSSSPRICSVSPWWVINPAHLPGLSQEEADLMRKGSPACSPPLELPEAGVLGQVLIARHKEQRA